MNRIQKEVYDKVKIDRKDEYVHSGAAAKGALVAISLMTFVHEVVNLLKMDDDD